jgi:hypothetical protein
MILCLHLLGATALPNHFLIQLQGFTEVVLVQGRYVGVKVAGEGLGGLKLLDLCIVFHIFLAPPHQPNVLFLNLAVLLSIAVGLATLPKPLSLSFFPIPPECADRLFPNDGVLPLLFFQSWQKAVEGDVSVLLVDKRSVLGHGNKDGDYKRHAYN